MSMGNGTVAGPETKRLISSPEGITRKHRGIRKTDHRIVLGLDQGKTVQERRWIETKRG